MVEPGYVPDRGDLVWLDFNPQSGREQMGRRPALVVSPRKYNAKTNLALFLPITSQVKGYPFEVKLLDNMSTKGVIIADQIKSLDWMHRHAEFIEKAPNSITQECLKKVLLLLQ